MDRLVRILWRWTLLVLFLVALFAACEDLVLRYRLKRHGPGAVIEQTSIYDAAENKGGRVEIYFDHPETRECVHAVLPHFGDAPCWYVKRHLVRLLSRLHPSGSSRCCCVTPRCSAGRLAGGSFCKASGGPQLACSS